MAWQWRLTAPVAKVGEYDARLQANIEYFDDLTPAVVLHRLSAQFDPTLPLVEMRNRVEAEGQRARAALTKASTVNGNAAFQPGAANPVP